MIENRLRTNAKGCSQLSAFMDGAGRLVGAVAANTAWKGKIVRRISASPPHPG
jgi:hypothetical protein